MREKECEETKGVKVGGEKEEKGKKKVALQTSPATFRSPGITGLFPGSPEKGGLELGPVRNQNQN